jgi:hypothetical protein
VVSVDEVQQLLALGHEIRSFEVKGPGELKDKAHCAKVARAAIAMGNLRDGGLICIGIDNKQLAAMLPGLNAAQLAGWSDFDEVSDALRRYVDPPVAFRLYPMGLSSGIDVVVIKVEEFEDVPHVCKRDFPGVLQGGMTYVRPRGKPESVPVPSSAEMREVLDLAITKGVREFIRRAGAAGVSFGPGRSALEVEREAFATEAALAWSGSTPAMEQILSLAHFEIAICPGPFDAARVSPGKLDALVLENAVRLRGWPVPFVDNRQPIARHGSWIGQDIEPKVVPHCEAWRACSSGQFLQRRVLATDMRDSQQLAPDAPGATGTVAVWDVLLYLVEVAELAARLATRLECENVAVVACLNGVAGRQLVSGDWSRSLNSDYVVSADRLDASEVVEAAHLVANPRDIGIQIAQRLMEQFGADLPRQVLVDWQEQVFRGQ